MGCSRHSTLSVRVAAPLPTRTTTHMLGLGPTELLLVTVAAAVLIGVCEIEWTQQDEQDEFFSRPAPRLHSRPPSPLISGPKDVPRLARAAGIATGRATALLVRTRRRAFEALEAADVAAVRVREKMEGFARRPQPRATSRSYATSRSCSTPLSLSPHFNRFAATCTPPPASWSPSGLSCAAACGSWSHHHRRALRLPLPLLRSGRRSRLPNPAHPLLH